ncbi:HD-GYP domain-containing protein [Defluviitalea phaphyphila]|uniref:HD-GYP domain-containing protein n=1 Tax=Defluviitalea phaphyphila TaxID=1473580 RepID=UPI0007312563|nr:HD-GYP domain-containing protein [Defluviitalea phaphyphila]
MAEKLSQIVSIVDLKPGMILAEDVFNSVGLRLLTKGTKLNERNIKKLNMYDIDYVLIDENISIKYKQQEEIKSKSIKKMEEFRRFKKLYDNGVDTLKDYINDIGEGKNIKISKLFSISKGIISTAKTKRDVFAFLYNLKDNDDYTYNHSINVSLLCNIFGQWLNFTEEDIEKLTVAGLLHDIGKTKISPEILNKPGKLNKKEFEEIKKHSIYGFRMLEDIDIDKKIKLAVLMHHEKEDGSGYPLGIKSQQIEDFAKIVAIADIYDAMTSNRSYREKFCPFKVIETFEIESYGKLDTKFLLSFLKNIAYNYLNCWVRLSTGEEGEIVFINPQHLSRPIVRIDNTMVDLKEESELSIEEII